MKRVISVIVVLFLGLNISNGQDIFQNIKGKVSDNISGESIIGATIRIENSNPLIGTTSDLNGNYLLQQIPVGRYSIVISCVGYKQVRVEEILLTSAREFILDVELESSTKELDGVVIVGRKGKEAINSMATLSARSFTIEESSRFAGGLSDPSRVAYNFAGVTFSAPQDNGVVVRGNAPGGILWRLNGIDVSGVAHFAGGNLAGAGLISTYSANLLKGSDFFAGAFPGEYSNSVSGVFDIEFRKPSTDEQKFLAQIGILGIDIAAEGPLSKKNGSSYLINYRHGFIGYYGAMAKGAEPHFKDLSFNVFLPTEKFGDFTVWGVGGLSKSIAPRKRYQEKYDDDTDSIRIKRREFFNDYLDKDISFGVGASGVNHRISLGKKAFLESALGVTSNYYENDTRYFIPDADTLNTGLFNPYVYHKSLESKVELASSLNWLINPSIFNETGIRANIREGEVAFKSFDKISSLVNKHYDLGVSATSLNAYTQFKFTLHPSLILNTGLAVNKFSECNEVSIEPRVGVKWQYANFGSLSLAYGKHSKQEELKSYFFTNPETGKRNELLLTKSNHYVASLQFNLSKTASLTIEGYYQELYDVPVIEGTPYSFVNYTRLWEVSGPISNKGTGTNKGIDVSLERTMKNGFYYLFTASVFDSKYIDDLGVERNTLFNRNFISTLAMGKEFVVAGKNMLGFNLNVTYMGGGRLTPILEQETIFAKEVIFDRNKLFSQQADPEIWLNAGISYKINKAKSTRTWGLDFQNTLITQQMSGYKYNLLEDRIEEDKVLFLLPNLYYKIEF